MSDFQLITKTKTTTTAATTTTVQHFGCVGECRCSASTALCSVDIPSRDGRCATKKHNNNNTNTIFG